MSTKYLMVYIHGGRQGQGLNDVPCHNYLNITDTMPSESKKDEAHTEHAAV